MLGWTIRPLICLFILFVLNTSILAKGSIINESLGGRSPNNLDTLYSMAVNSLGSNIGTSILLADSLRVLSIKLKDRYMESNACTILGEAYFYRQNNEKAIHYFSKSLELMVGLKDKAGEGAAYNSLGIVYSKWDYSKGLKYYTKSLALKEELKDSIGASAVLNNIGTIYDLYIKDYAKALNYYSESYEIEQKYGDPEGIATSLLNIGDLHRKMNHSSLARKFLLASLEICNSANLDNINMLVCESLYKLYDQEGKWKDAYLWYKRFAEQKVDQTNKNQQKQVAELEVKYKTEEQTNQIRLLRSEQLINDRALKNQRYALYLMAVFLLGIFAFSWILIGKSNKIRITNKLLEDKNEEIQIQQEEMKAQSELLEKSNAELQKLSIVASKTDNSVIVARADGEIEWVNDGFTRMLGISFNEFKDRYSGNFFNSSLNPDIRSVVDAAVQKQKSVHYSSQTYNRQGRELWLHTTLTPIFDESGKLIRLIAIDSDISRLKKTEKVLAIKQAELTDSIQYAQKLQVSMLPSPHVFSECFEESFVLYKPRDIVSGDFYWLNKRHDIIWLVAADCTGHGVPGAFMSVIGISLLNELLHQQEVRNDNAAGILSSLRVMVKKSLSAGEEKGEMHDGMDFSLCIINLSKQEMQFSGAYHSLFINRKDGSELEEIRGDKMPVGDYPTDSESFSNHTVPIHSGDIIYLQSDGFWHQIGGPAGKKFGKKRYIELLRQIQGLSITEQQRQINEVLNKWMQDPEKPNRKLQQMDDIMVLACRI
jgi:PAS domain S-box-containing protein